MRRKKGKELEVYGNGAAYFAALMSKLHNLLYVKEDRKGVRLEIIETGKA